MTQPDPVRGGYPCPFAWCTYRAVVPSLLAQHVREEHPDEENP